MKIVWSPLAIERVETIADYIAVDNPNAADKWVKQLFSKVERLSLFPKSGRKVAEAARSDIREIPCAGHRVIYRVVGRQIWILTVRHGRQKLPAKELT
jgi:plasmid stabilization system protein ParE